jgi:nucleoside-diphosphate-sugar epimerase
MQEEDLAIFGDGEQRTAFTYIKDIIPGIAESINNKFDLNQTFNIDADKDYSVNRLAKTVMKTMGIEVKVRYVESRKELKIAYSDHSKFVSCDCFQR